MQGGQNRTNYNSDEPILILSSDEKQQNGASGVRPGFNKQKKPPAAPDPDSSSDDDPLVVKTEPCTIDPITRKQIKDPVKNKKCSHIYGKSTIYGLINQARSNSKSVRCPYVGCNQKDFKKTDLVKDKDVIKYLGR